jgi:Na+-exporting ATPase
MARKQQPVQRTNKHPCLLSVGETVRQLDTNIETGLSARKVQELQRECPLNELDDGGGIAWYKILIKQMTNAMILVSLAIDKSNAKKLTTLRFLSLPWP